MAALAGEPWRALSKIQLDGTLGAFRDFIISVADLDPNTATGNQVDWEGTPGSSVALRFEWSTTGAPTFGVANEARVNVRLPGDASNIGSQWTVTIGSASGSATRTFHFDDDPLNEAAGTSRAGMVEVFFDVRRTDAVAWGAVDSRGGGTPPAGVTHNWARGYWRAKTTLSAFSISNVSLGGAEPASFAFPDSTFNRATLDAVWYRSAALAIAHRQASANKRTNAGSATTAVNRDYTFNTTSTTVTGNGRINNSYTIGSTATDVRLSLPANVFGGTTSDKEYAWAASGHTAGWAVSGDDIEDAARFTADPRLTFTQLLQVNDNVFGTPPSSKNVATGVRKTFQMGFVAARAVNARSEGQNGVVWNEKLWDDDELTGSEATPTATRSATSATQGGEAGWSDMFLTWDESLPAGDWTHKQVITTADATGLELTNTRALSLASPDSTIILTVGFGDPNTAQQHWNPGKALTVGLALTQANAKITPDSGSTKFSLIRFKPATGTTEFLNASLDWVTGDTFHQFTATPSPGDAKLAIYSFTAAQTATTLPGAQAWNYEDIFVHATATFDGTSYYRSAQFSVTGTSFQHDGSFFTAGVLVENIVKQGSSVPFVVAVYATALTDASSTPTCVAYKKTPSGALTTHSTITLTKRSGTTGLYDGTLSVDALPVGTDPEVYEIVTTVTLSGTSLAITRDITVLAECEP